MHQNVVVKLVDIVNTLLVHKLLDFAPEHRLSTGLFEDIGWQKLAACLYNLS